MPARIRWCVQQPSARIEAAICKEEEHKECTRYCHREALAASPPQGVALRVGAVCGAAPPHGLHVLADRPLQRAEGSLSFVFMQAC